MPSSPATMRRTGISSDSWRSSSIQVWRTVGRTPSVASSDSSTPYSQCAASMSRPSSCSSSRVSSACWPMSVKYCRTRSSVSGSSVRRERARGGAAFGVLGEAPVDLPQSRLVRHRSAPACAAISRAVAVRAAHLGDSRLIKEGSGFRPVLVRHHSPPFVPHAPVRLGIRGYSSTVTVRSRAPICSRV